LRHVSRRHGWALPENVAKDGGTSLRTSAWKAPRRRLGHELAADRNTNPPEYAGTVRRSLGLNIDLNIGLNIGLNLDLSRVSEREPYGPPP
jgi:hypothetical protein